MTIPGFIHGAGSSAHVFDQIDVSTGVVWFASPLAPWRMASAPPSLTVAEVSECETCTGAAWTLPADSTHPVVGTPWTPEPEQPLQPVPEPATWVFVAAGLAALILRRLG